MIFAKRVLNSGAVVHIVLLGKRNSANGNNYSKHLIYLKLTKSKSKSFMEDNGIPR